MDNVDIKMVLEVLAHPGKMMDRVHSDLAKMISVANTRQHQQLGSVYSASTEDDLV